MPTHVAGRETVQDPVRLKNMLAEAERRLVDDGGMRRPDAAEILKPGHLLVDDPDFWRHQSTGLAVRSEEHTSELQSLMRISYAVFCLHKKKNTHLYPHT